MTFAAALAAARLRARLPAGAYLPAELDRPLRGARVAVVDTETTGLSGDARVVEVAVVVIDELGSSAPRTALATLVNPAPVEIDGWAYKTHGIGRRHVAKAPPWEAVWPLVAEAVSGAVWCGHNTAFDHRIIDREAQDLSLPRPPERGLWIDTLAALKVLDSHHKSRSLEAACERRGLVAGAHRAEADALATALLLRKVVEELEESEYAPAVTGTVRDFLRWLALPQKQRAKAPVVEQVELPRPADATRVEGLPTREEVEERERRAEIGRTSTVQSGLYRMRRVALEPVQLPLPKGALAVLWRVEDGTLPLPAMVPDLDGPYDVRRWRTDSGRLRYQVRWAAEILVSWELLERGLWKALVRRVAAHLDQGAELVDLRLPGWSWEEICEAAAAARGTR